MPEITTRSLFTLRLDVAAPLRIGAAPGRNLNVVSIIGGTFEGDRLRGTVAPGGSDWLEPRPDGSNLINVRAVLQTDDGALIAMTYRGLRVAAADVADRLQRGENVDPSEYYFRISVMFETESENYAWLNKIIGVATGERPPGGPIYHVFEVL
jgi:hypothetical protein